MSSVENRAGSFKRLTVPSFVGPRIPRPWVEARSEISAIVAQAWRDLEARRRLRLSLQRRAVAMVEALA